jgi:hypothetical protein
MREERVPQLSVVDRARRRTLRGYRRTTRNPFADQRWLLVHGAHHKAGTVWFRRVLQAVATEYGLRFFGGSQDDLPPQADLFFQDNSWIDADALQAFRGSHVIRDPRDLVVSGYHYHLWTGEAWAHEPWPSLGGKTYQEHLRSLDEDGGLHAEIDRVAKMALDMVRWDYDDARFVNLRYEDVVADGSTAFTTIFQHYGFSDAAVARSTEIALGFTLEKAAAIPKPEGKSHVRSGKPGEWRDRFTAAHLEHCKEAMADTLVALGYESGTDW